MHVNVSFVECELFQPLMGLGIQLTEVSEERCFAAHESGLQLLGNVVEVLKRELRIVYGPELEV